MVDVEEAQVMEAYQHTCTVACRTGAVAVELHFRIVAGHFVDTHACCAKCIKESHRLDERNQRWRAENEDAPFLPLYLPIIQPIVGDENWIAVECFMHAISRLLLACDEKARAA